MDPAYAKNYRDLARHHWWWQARNAYVRRRVSALLGSRQDARILDIGCGDAVLFPFLSGFGHVEGVEPDPLVVTPNGPWRHRIHQRAFDSRFTAPEPFDLIVLLDVIEHVDDPAGLLRHAATLLTRDGCLLVTVPALPILWTHHDDLNRHRQRFTRSALETVATEAGLATRSIGYLFQWMVVAKLAQRLKERLVQSPEGHGIPPAPVNGLLYALCRAEQRLFGERLPFGSSLIAELTPPGQ